MELFPKIAALFYGVKPVVIVIIAQGAYRLVRSAVKSAWLGMLGTMALAAAAFGIDPLAVLCGAGALAGVVHLRHELAKRPASLGTVAATSASLAAPSIPFSLSFLFLVMLKIGATLFGGGYVLVAFLRADLVSRLHWLTERQLLDAVAAGQVTPGPLFTTATFIGYVLGGHGSGCRDRRHLSSRVPAGCHQRTGGAAAEAVGDRRSRA